ncbi:MAG: NAD(P)/FAD-dependent oxidoreductase [Bacteroidetes bacterium]|nr:NAD(P)/FAD-dependent oxidoreductase [Bacteroidota bacterium]
MQKLELKQEYDVIVIGAGVGGLTAAALLSKAGYSVCVLEKEPHAGGYLAGFRRKNFRFDTAIHWLNQCMPGGMAAMIFDILGSDHPVAVPQKHIRRYKGETYDYLLTNNPEELKAQLIADYPHEREGLERFFKTAKRLGKSFANFGHVFRSEETMTPLERMKNKLNLLKFAMPFIPLISYTGDEGIKKGLNKYFKDEGLHKIFSADTELLSCLVPIGWAYYGDYQSPPKGGGQVIPEWMQHIIEFYGNDLFFKCNVKEILLENGVSKGVRFEHRGKEYTAKSRYVIAACDVETLYEKMLPQDVVPEKFKAKLRKADLYSSSVTVSIALDCPTAELGFGEELVHISSENVSRADHLSGDPEKSEISILPPSLRDPSLAPEGQGTLVLFMPAFMDFNNHWLTGRDKDGNYVRNEAYNKLKNEIAEVLIRRVEERIAPGLRKHILFYDVATPVTHWRYTGNKNGTMMGAKPGRENMQGKIAHYRTPVKNLLLSGHWAELGGGVPIAVKAGANAALLILKDENKAAFKVLADYMDGNIPASSVLNSKYFKPYDNSWVQAPTPAQKYAMRMQAGNVPAMEEEDEEDEER